MDLFREWLGPTIEQALDDVLQWRSKSEANRAQLTGQVGNLTFDDDGSNLRITSVEAQVVQIIKLMPNQEPLQGCLSDSLNRVDATISKDAVQRYTNKSGKRLTDGTVGGFIQLINFEIVATHIGSKQKRITLLVTDFKLVGSNTSGPFGIPQAIQDRPKIKDLLVELISFRAQECASSKTLSRQQYMKDVPVSQPESIASQGDSPPGTQTMFATQAPLPKLPVTSSPKAKASNGLSVNQRKSLSDVPHAKVHPPFNRSKASATRAEDLLSLLQPKKHPPSTKAATEEANKPQAVIDLTNKSETGPFLNQMNSLRSPKNTVIGTTDDPGQSFALASTANNYADFNEMNRSQLASPASKWERKRSEIRRSSRPRIRSREVRVPKDQAELLDSVDSWLPAEPGRRGPVANLPISILRSLNEKADLEASKKGMILRGKPETSGCGGSQEGYRRSSFGDGRSSQPESESDAPFPTSEWPPSPAPDQLPPDSSAESPDAHSSRSAQIRRSSIASLSSRVTQSRRSTPLRVIRSSRKSGEPSPTVRSPSIVSNPVIHGSQRQSRVGTPKSSASRTSTLVSIGATSDSHGMEPSVSSEGCRRDNGGEAEGEVRSALQDATPALIGQENSRVSEVLYGIKPNPNDQRGSSPKTAKAKPLPYHDIPQEGGFSPHKAMFPFSPRPLQPSRAHYNAEKLHSGHARNASPRLFSIPPSPESDLEMVTPFSLDDKASPQQDSTHRAIPATAFQPIEPFTQVKRTPYINGQIRDYSPPRRKRRLSLSTTDDSHSLVNGVPPDDIDHVTQSTPSLLELSSSEAFTGNRKEVLDTNNVDQTLEPSNSIEGLRGQISLDIKPTETDKPSHEQEENYDPEEPETPPHPSVSEVEGAVGGIAMSDLNTAEIHGEDVIKRKVSDSDWLSANVAKRRKKFKTSRPFPVTEDIGNRPDPADAARRYRQDFLSSRKSSEADKGKESLAASTAVTHQGFGKIGEPSPNAGVPFSGERGIKRQQQPSTNYNPIHSGLEKLLSMKLEVIRSEHSLEDDRLQENESRESQLPQSPVSIKKTHNSVEKDRFNSIPQKDPRRPAPLAELDENYSALKGTLSRGRIMDDLSESIVDLPGKNTWEDAVARATLDTTSGPTIDVANAQDETPTDHTVYREAKVARHDCTMTPEPADTSSGARDTEANGPEPEAATLDISHNQAARNDERGQIVLAEPNVTDIARQYPGKHESFELHNGSDSLASDHDPSADAEVKSATSGAERDQSMSIESRRPTAGKESISPSDLMADEPKAGVDSKIVDAIDSSLSLAESEFHLNVGRRRPLQADHQETSLGSSNVSESHLPADLIAHAIIPTARATMLEGPKSQENQEVGTPAIALSVQPGQSEVALRPPPQPSVGALVMDSNLDFHVGSQPVDRGGLARVDTNHTDVQMATISPTFPVEQNNPEPRPAPPNIFDRFKATYSGYPGDMRHFVAVCRKVRALSKANRMLHQFLWDDFIIRHKMEYAEHLRQCAEDAEDALPYEDFYKSEISKPLYCNSVINPQTLDEAISLVDMKSTTPKKRSASDVDIQSEPKRNHWPLREASLAPKRASTNSQQRFERRETIDLTLDDRDDVKVSDEKSMTPPMNSIPKAPRASSWKESNTRFSMNSSQNPGEPVLGPDKGHAYRRMSNVPSQSVHAQNRCTLAGRESSVEKNPQPELADLDAYATRIQAAWGVGADDILDPKYYDRLTTKKRLNLLAEIASTVNLEEARRLIMTQILERHSRNPDGATPRLRTGDLKAARAMARENDRIKLSRDCNQPVKDTPMNYEEKIRYAWGIGPESVLEARYYHESTLTPRVVQLLAEIADLTKNLIEARNLIKEHIRTTHWARRGDKTMNATDLEHVKRRLISRDVPDTGTQQQDQTEAGQWWKDNNTPFKSFAKAYLSIKPGNGNSYAADFPPKQRSSASQGRTGGQKHFRKEINPLEWEL